LAAAAVLHLALVLGECSLTHGTAHARLATLEMVRGRFRRWFRAGIVLAAAAAVAGGLGTAAASGARAALASVPSEAARMNMPSGPAGISVFGPVAAAVEYTMLAIWLALAAAPLALAGLLAFEHAYVQAGQSAPLA